MKILFTRFPLESRFGGAEVQTLLLAEGLRQHGHAVAFLGSCPILCEKMTKHRFPITKLEIGPPPVTKWHAASFLWRKQRMRKMLVDAVGAQHAAPLQRIDAIFMLSLSEKLLVTDWCVEQGMKVFWIEHDRVGRWLTCNPWLPRLRRLSRLATTVVVSDLSREIYLKLGLRQEDVVSIPNGVDAKMFAQDAAGTAARPHARDARATQFRLGCIARLTRDKGVDVLLKALALRVGAPRCGARDGQCRTDICGSNDSHRAPQRGAPTHLRVVGEGPQRSSLETLAHKLNLTNLVTIEPSTDVQTFYQSIDALVLPSREHDPFGFVVAEAMAAGVPTICTDACGISAHLNPEDALIVEAGSVSALRDAIVEVQKPEVWQRLAERGPGIARERFSVETMVEKYIDLL